MTTATLPEVIAPVMASAIVTTPAPIIPGGQYPMTRNSDGTWNAYGIPLMGVMKKGDKGLPVDLGVEWQKKAVATAQSRFHSGAFLHPLHLNHTSDKRGKVAAGFFLPTHVAELQYDGKPMSTIFGDYIAVTDWAAREMQAGRWPYGSIENFDFEAAEINEYAVMADSEPWFHFPMQTYRVVEGTEAAAINVYDKRQFQLAKATDKGFALVRVEGGKATFCAMDPKKPDPAADPAIPAADPAKKDPTQAAADPAKPDPAADPNADPEMAMPPWAAQLCDMVKEMYARTCAPEAAKAKNPTPAEQPPPADPGKGSALSKETPMPDLKPEALELIKKTAEADGLAEKNAALEADKASAKAIDDMVTEAEKKLAGRIRNADRIHKSLLEMAKSGKAQLDAYVSVLEASLAPSMPKTSDGVTKAITADADAAKKPDAPAKPAALDLQAKYGHSPALFAAATKAAAEFEAQKSHLSLSREEYVAFALSQTTKEA